MNINYHYFAIKTLAYAAGFSEQDAQTIAYYSQQVDDFTKCTPMCVRQEPPAYFLENHYARKAGAGLWLVLPHPTGIDVAQSLEKHYQQTTLIPFHFIPARSLKELEADPDFTRADYRCVRADDERALLINQIIGQAIESVRNEKTEKNLMQLGMALHAYADTYAHCGYSGSDGWENHAVIKGAYNQQTGKEEVSPEERFAYRSLPHIGHGNAGHVPDVCTYQIDVAMQKDEQDHKLSQHIVRDNLQEFLNCSKAILKLLYLAAQTDSYEKIIWDDFKELLARAMQVPTVDELNKKKLIAHWGNVFPEIIYTYDKNQRFYVQHNSLEDIILEEIGNLEEIITEGTVIYDVTDAFYMYNELAYRRAELVNGTAELLARNAQMLEEKRKVLVTMQESTYGDDWSPQTELGLAVQAAGFTYDPDLDIICSTMNNIQRSGGYCRGYDDAAIAMGSVIDSEPIYFSYDGYEWMIELWKGQYGIETGCEIGIYYREQDKPLSVAEKTVLGRLYDCVPNERMLDLRFVLRKDGAELFSRSWTKHWWLTGFRWGISSEPEQLMMNVGIHFPSSAMQQAFVQQGLKAAGYSYMETDICSVEFNFAKPMALQPAVRDMMRESMQTLNRELIKAYNNARAKYGITTNDPNVIDQIIHKQAGAAEKKLLEKLVHHFGRKSQLKSELQRHGG